MTIITMYLQRMQTSDLQVAYDITMHMPSQECLCCSHKIFRPLLYYYNINVPPLVIAYHVESEHTQQKHLQTP